MSLFFHATATISSDESLTCYDCDAAVMVMNELPVPFVLTFDISVPRLHVRVEVNLTIIVRLKIFLLPNNLYGHMRASVPVAAALRFLYPAFTLLNILLISIASTLPLMTLTVS
jgi:hypothetical protein